MYKYSVLCILSHSDSKLSHSDSKLSHSDFCGIVVDTFLLDMHKKPYLKKFYFGYFTYIQVHI